MYHADDQNGGVVIGEVAERGSCIGHPPCYSYPSSAESHFVNDVPGFPMAFAARGMTNCNQPDEKGTSRGPGSEILNSEVAITNNQFAPSVRQAHAGSIRSGHLLEDDGNREQFQSPETAEKCTLAFKEELADILACIFAEMRATGRLHIPLGDNQPLIEG
jgi:hypothetical protein